MQKIPVYFMPGLAANSAIFENIKLDQGDFEIFFLDWKIPYKRESLQEYARRIAEDIEHKNPVLIGMSFGGILVQEIKNIIPVRKTIIISSAKSNREFPRWMRLARLTRFYKLFPIRVISNVERIPEIINKKFLKGRKEIYKTYMSVRDEFYLKWSIEQIILWKRKIADPDVVHIHGSKDEVFPIKYIEDCFVVEKGTHVMILNRFRWMNKHLPDLIRK